MKFLILLMALLLLPACCDDEHSEQQLRMNNMRLDNDIKVEKLRILKIISTNIPIEVLLEEDDKCLGRELSEQAEKQQKNSSRNAATGSLIAHQVVRSNAARSRGHH